MFGVTRRLLLRPGWTEDAPLLAETIADERMVRNLMDVTGPYAWQDAEAGLSKPGDIYHPAFLIFERTVDPVRLIGSVGFGDRDGVPDLGYWIAPDRWGRGFATEAARAAIEAVRASLGYLRITATHFIGNPASERVLEKLGFHKAGRTEKRHSNRYGCAADCVVFEQNPTTRVRPYLPPPRRASLCFVANRDTMVSTGTATQTPRLAMIRR